MFNSQERTLREITELALSAGWKVVKVTRSEGLFGQIVAVPITVNGPRDVMSAENDSPEPRCATPTFGSRVDLPSVEELARRFGGAVSTRSVKRRNRVPPLAPASEGMGLLQPAPDLPQPRAPLGEMSATRWRSGSARRGTVMTVAARIEEGPFSEGS